MEYGIIRGESNYDYHKTEAISSSMLKGFISDPRAYYGTYVSGEHRPQRNTNAFDIGSAFHSLALEGTQAFQKEFYVVPEGVGKVRKADKALRAELKEANPYKTELAYKDYDLCIKMLEGIRDNEFVSNILSDGEPEVGFRVNYDGLTYQCRADWLVDNNGDSWSVVDLKTTSSPLEKITDDIIKYHYNIQAAFYAWVIEKTTGLPVTNWSFVFCEKNYPYQSMSVELGPAVMDAANRKMEAAREELETCYLTNNFPKQTTNIVLEDELNDWQLRKLGVDI